MTTSQWILHKFGGIDMSADAVARFGRQNEGNWQIYPQEHQDSDWISSNNMTTSLWCGENWYVYNKPDTTVLQEIGRHRCLVGPMSSRMEEVDDLSTISRWKQGRLQPA